MKFKVKTLDHRDFTVEFSDLRNVWELKKHICRMRGSWLHPENQRILYAGQVLDDQKQLRTYCIDERKFLLMLPRKAPPRNLKQSSSSTSTSMNIVEEATPKVQPMYIPTGIVKEHIMKLGPWKESEVRRALLISLNNPNRAVDYLLTGTAPFQNMISPPSSRLFLTKSNKEIREAISIPQSPELQTECDSGYEFEGCLSPEQLSSKEKVVTWNLPESKTSLKTEPCGSMNGIQRLVNIGFPEDIVMEAYRACDGNIEETAMLLFEQYIDEIARLQRLSL